MNLPSCQLVQMPTLGYCFVFYNVLLVGTSQRSASPSGAYLP